MVWLISLSPRRTVAAQQGHFTWTPEARQAYFLATSLRFSEASAVLQQMQRNDPQNVLRPFIENYIDFFTVFLNENEQEYKLLRKRLDGRLSAIRTGNSLSPYYRYCQAEMQLQWAIVRGKFGEYLTAIQETRSAFLLLTENRRLYPDFMANLKSLGVLHALVGTIPGEYRWAIHFFGGMNGTIQQGLSELETVIRYSLGQPDFIFGKECLVVYAFLLKHLGNQSEAAWETLNCGKLDPTQNPLENYALASLAMKTGRNDEAIRLLESAPHGGNFHPFWVRYLLLGIGKLQRLDPDAHLPLERFVTAFRGINGIKEAYQKLAWQQLLQGNFTGYHNFMQKVKTEGTDYSEPDKAALREANSLEVPHPILLKARLLFDGGYYLKAYQLLQPQAHAFHQHTRWNLEYLYRMGRITHQLRRFHEAVAYYKATIQKGEKQPWYFACNAALQLGLLHEEQRNLPAARAAYRLCLKIEPDEYAASLHARAKAGLNRLNN